MVRILAAVAAAFVAASLSDWLFMGILFHERYNTFREIWRPTDNERSKILVAQIHCLMTAVGFVSLAILLGPFSLRGAWIAAALVWLIGPLPLLLGNHLFIKLDRYVTGAHAVGWLVKLLVVASLTALIL